MQKYEVMKENTILGPFDINQIAEFVRAGLILKRDYAEDSAQMVPLVAVNMVPLIALNMVPGVALNMVPGLDALQER